MEVCHMSKKELSCFPLGVDVVTNVITLTVRNRGVGITSASSRCRGDSSRHSIVSSRYRRDNSQLSIVRSDVGFVEGTLLGSFSFVCGTVAPLACFRCLRFSLFFLTGGGLHVRCDPQHVGQRLLS